MNYSLHSAALEDLAQIFQLYARVYGGTYPDKTFSNVERLEKVLRGDTEKQIFMAKRDDGSVCATVLFQWDEDNGLAKAGAAVVDSTDRGNDLTEKLLEFGILKIQQQSKNSLEVLYATTRTVHKAAQVLTQKVGFKQLGIFPNVHKTIEYETHALSAKYFGDTLSKRYSEFSQHPMVSDLFNIVAEVLNLPSMDKTNDWDKKVFKGIVPTLEVIEASEFVYQRMEDLKNDDKLDLAFFPFHRPTMLITSPNRAIEVFAHVNETDKYCVITGCKIDRDVSFEDLFLAIGNILRDRGVRYIEVIIKANRLNIIDKICAAKFIPCGYFPAFQLEGNKRYDYVVFSRSFEILDFNNIEVSGKSTLYFKNYISLWKQRFLGEFFK